MINIKEATIQTEDGIVLGRVYESDGAFYWASQPLELGVSDPFDSFDDAAEDLFTSLKLLRDEIDSVLAEVES